MEPSPQQEIRRFKQIAKMSILAANTTSAVEVLNQAKEFSTTNFLPFQTVEIGLDIAQLYLDADIIVEASRTLKELKSELRYMPKQKKRWNQLNQAISAKTVLQK